MDASTLAIIGAIGTIVGLLINVNKFSKERDKDVHEKATQQAIINTKLDNICGGIDSMRIDIKNVQCEQNRIMQQIVRVEEKTDSAHKRIDKLEGKFNGY